jgi:hypothetical protein
MCAQANKTTHTRMITMCHLADIVENTAHYFDASWMMDFIACERAVGDLRSPSFRIVLSLS